MKEAVEYGINVFCKDILDLKPDRATMLGNNFYGASIQIYENSTEINWILLFKKDTLKTVAQILLFEDDLSEEDYIDLLKEVSNQIIGIAKVKLEEKNQNKTYKLGTPKFLGHVSAPIPFKLENKLLYKVKNRTFLVAEGSPAGKIKNGLNKNESGR